MHALSAVPAIDRLVRACCTPAVAEAFRWLQLVTTEDIAHDTLLDPATRRPVGQPARHAGTARGRGGGDGDAAPTHGHSRGGSGAGHAMFAARVEAAPALPTHVRGGVSRTRWPTDGSPAAAGSAMPSPTAAATPLPTPAPTPTATARTTPWASPHGGTAEAPQPPGRPALPPVAARSPAALTPRSPRYQLAASLPLPPSDGGTGHVHMPAPLSGPPTQPPPAPSDGGGGGAAIGLRVGGAAGEARCFQSGVWGGGGECSALVRFHFRPCAGTALLPVAPNASVRLTRSSAVPKPAVSSGFSSVVWGDAAGGVPEAQPAVHRSPSAASGVAVAPATFGELADGCEPTGTTGEDAGGPDGAGSTDGAGSAVVSTQAGHRESIIFPVSQVRRHGGGGGGGGEGGGRSAPTIACLAWHGGAGQGGGAEPPTGRPCRWGRRGRRVCSARQGRRRRTEGGRRRRRLRRGSA
jgi:hypothetical protein